MSNITALLLILIESREQRVSTLRSICVHCYVKNVKLKNKITTKEQKRD